jgi:hypothetical protein
MRVKGVILFFFFLPTFTNSQCIEGNCISGFGTYKYGSGAKYQGSFLNGKINGQGTLYFSNGDIYTGSWKSNYMDGSGELSYANGDKYIGQFKNNKKSGIGKLISKNRVYTGHFLNGKFHGKGRIELSNGETKVGKWINGKLMESVDEENSQIASSYRVKPDKTQPEKIYSEKIESSLVNTNPTKTRSELKDCNVKYCHEENGKYTYRDGSYFVGPFTDGKPFGEGICYYSNGDKYSGFWKYNIPHGVGTLTKHNGESVKAKWYNGKATERLHEYAKFDPDPNDVEVDPDVRIWALVVGVARYYHMPTLKYTDDDAYRMYAFLKSPEGGAIPDDQINILVDEVATRKNILASMHDLFSKADENDVIVLYLSGHGLKGSFIPFDFDGKNNRVFYEEINDAFNKSQAKSKVCFADACFAGSLQNSKAVASKLRNYYTLLNNSSGGTAFFLSSKEQEESLEDRGLRQGIFSHFLIRGLKGEADSNKDKIVKVGELFDFVDSSVKRYTKYEQHPVLVGTYNRDMPLAFIRSNYFLGFPKTSKLFIFILHSIKMGEEE